ncbi:hypothetical protein ACFQU7_26995 [Pseudoroseomonas wenyumeiae]
MESPGFSTSVAAFVGHIVHRLSNQPVQIFNLVNFERRFGWLHDDSKVSSAICCFFLEGGVQACVARASASAARPGCNKEWR